MRQNIQSIYYNIDVSCIHLYILLIWSGCIHHNFIRDKVYFSRLPLRIEKIINDTIQYSVFIFTITIYSIIFSASIITPSEMDIIFILHILLTLICMYYSSCKTNIFIIIRLYSNTWFFQLLRALTQYN